jgi:hypothetical protein
VGGKTADRIGDLLVAQETIVQAAGFPALVQRQRGEADKPLVAFVTGGGVLARIAYGHPKGRPSDFLFHWLCREGFSTLGMSYPIAHPAFSGCYPDFGMHDWAVQCAELIAGAVADYGLSKRVLVLAWSMAGRLAEPLKRALEARNIEIELFVAMTASTPLPNLLPGLASITPSPAGLGRTAGSFQDWLLRNLSERNEEAGREIIAPAIFADEFLGDFPIRLSASAMRYENGAFRADPAGDAGQTGAARYENFPMLAFMTHTSALDSRHALTDRAAWGFYITQSLTEAQLFARRADMGTLAPDDWAQALKLIQAAPERLTVTLPGNHLFFVGEAGARRTAAALGSLRSEAETLLSEIANVMESGAAGLRSE